MRDAGGRERKPSGWLGWSPRRTTSRLRRGLAFGSTPATRRCMGMQDAGCRGRGKSAVRSARRKSSGGSRDLLREFCTVERGPNVCVQNSSILHGRDCGSSRKYRRIGKFKAHNVTSLLWLMHIDFGRAQAHGVLRPDSALGFISWLGEWVELSG